MQSKIESPELVRARKVIGAANLHPVVARLVHEYQWTNAEAWEAVRQYRRFMYLQKKYGAELELPPSREVDEVWHAHILHTKEYSEFCDAVFGAYLHHTPGEAGEAGVEKYERMFNEHTQRLFWEEYGERLCAIRDRARSVMAALVQRSAVEQQC